MKPTEAGIQAELIEGWSIHHVEEGTLYAKNSGMLVALYRPEFISIDFMYSFNDRISIRYTDFLTGNYDLSAISQHYEPEEWQRIITMCESIVRLITGEQVEQTLEEAVRGWLNGVDGARLESVEDHRVCVVMGTLRYWITAEEVSSLNVDCGSGYTPDSRSVESYIHISPLEDEWKEAVHNIATEIKKRSSTRSTKPSYSDLEQRVEELEKQNGELFKQNARLIRERDEAEAKLQDCPTEKDMEDFEQLYDKEMARKDRMIAALRKDKDHLQEKANLYQFAVEQSFKNAMEASQ